MAPNASLIFFKISIILMQLNADLTQITGETTPPGGGRTVRQHTLMKIVGFSEMALYETYRKPK